MSEYVLAGVIGLGVGIVLGLLVLGGWVWFRWRQA